MQCFYSRFAITACHVMELSQNNLFDKKERKKEDDEFCVLDVEWFQTLAILMQVFASPNTVGKAEDYLVSVYIIKVNLFV